MCRRSSCETWHEVAVRRVAELAEHPGAEDSPQSWQGTDYLRVRVLLKIRG